MVPPNWKEPKPAFTPPLALIVPPFKVTAFNVLKLPFDDNVPPLSTKVAAVVVPA